MNHLQRALMTAAAALPLAAQDPAHIEIFERKTTGIAMPGMLMQSDSPVAGARQMVQFISAETVMADKPVKGKPYSAEQVNETTQTLPDGNRIRNSSSSQVYRDSEGRTRREATMPALPFAAAADLPQLVFINDPVSGFRYVLDMKARSAQKMKLPDPAAQASDLRAKLEKLRTEAGATNGGNVAFATATAAGEGPGDVHTFTYSSSHHASASEQKSTTTSLGKQMMEGVEVEGTRTTWSIPAGQIGNDRPIDVVSERWYSPELETVVMSRHSDPRTGENVFRLTNISRSDPPRTMFEPPADFKINESKGGDVIRMRLPAPPAK